MWAQGGHYFHVMRVLQIVPELNVGGVETGTIDFAAYLVKHGHGSFVISHGGLLVRDLESGGVQALCFTGPQKIDLDDV